MEIKKDCYCYDVFKNNCKGLNELYCKEEHCKFYKTKKQGFEDWEKAHQRYLSKN